jgi:oxygen-dependent protoporphyrinogen oxidase
MERPSQNSKRRIVVIGGGISGLAAAHRLVEFGEQIGNKFEIQLLEAGARAGGIIKTERRDDFLLECGPDSFISEKPEAIALAERLGLKEHLIETSATHRRSFIVRGGRLHAVPEGFQLLAPSRLWPFITSGIFSWAGKARMALDLVLPRRSGLNGNDDDESLAQFVRRRLGQEALARMAQPMVGGIYTADPESLSLRATMPRFLRMEREDRSLIWAMWKQRRTAATPQQTGTSGARYSLFLTFDEGMQLLVDRLMAKLPANVVRLNTKVESLVFDETQRSWSLRLKTGETLSADAVCLALPAYAAARLLSDVDGKLAASLNSIPYASTATINLAWRREDIPHALDGFGFVVPFVERRSLLACTFSSQKFTGRAPEGYALLRAFVGGALQPEMFELDEDEMRARVLFDLRALIGVEKPPLFATVEKWPRSMAQYVVGHLAKVEGIKERLSLFPILRLAGNAYHGAGIPDCIRSGEAAASEMIAALSEEAK